MSDVLNKQPFLLCTTERAVGLLSGFYLILSLPSLFPPFLFPTLIPCERQEIRIFACPIVERTPFLTQK